MFTSNYNRGFHMKFKNGLCVSVQWGMGSYCSRRSMHGAFDADLKTPITESSDAEIAIWNDDGEWFNFGYDQVKGYIDADEVAQWIEITKNAMDLHHIGHMARMKGMMPPLPDKYEIESTYTDHIISRAIDSQNETPKNQ